MNFNVNQKIGAEFKLIVRKSSDNAISSETEFFTNLVLDTGLNRMNVGRWIDRCCVGAGNSTPIITQTALDTFIASTLVKQNPTTAIGTVSPCFYSVTLTWRFAAGIATGNLSEVGLGWGDTNLWNRSLIKDINGNPTTITILADEYLDVISVIKVYPSELISGAFNLVDKNDNLISSHSYSGIPYLTTDGLGSSFEAVNIGASRLDVGFVVYSGTKGQNTTSLPTGQITSITAGKKITRSGRTSKNAILFDLNTGNSIAHKSIYAGVGGVVTTPTIDANSCGYQIEFTPALRIKLPTQTMIYNLSITWGRIT